MDFFTSSFILSFSNFENFLHQNVPISFDQLRKRVIYSEYWIKLSIFDLQNEDYFESYTLN